MRSLRGENLVRVTYWSQTLRSWRRWTHRKSNLKDSMRKSWYFPQKKENLFFQSHMDESNFLEEIRNWGTSILIRERPLQGESHIDFLGESEGSLPPPQDSLLVHVRKRHFPPSRWTQSQTSLAERRIIPYSTELRRQPWMLCKKAASMIVGISMDQEIFVWFLDRFHPVYSIEWETSKRIYVVRGETDKTASDIQARSFIARTLERISKKC